MNWLFMVGGALMVVIGAVHSVLGERLIFERLREGGLVPTKRGGLLRESHVRIIWATWHLGSALGLGMAALLFWLAAPGSAGLATSAAPLAIGAAIGASSLLVLWGTKGRHPGWIGLLAAALATFGGWLIG